MAGLSAENRESSFNDIISAVGSRAAEQSSIQRTEKDEVYCILVEEEEMGRSVWIETCGLGTGTMHIKGNLRKQWLSIARYNTFHVLHWSNHPTLRSR